jgi:hypothetical protein
LSVVSLGVCVPREASARPPLLCVVTLALCLISCYCLPCVLGGGQYAKYTKLMSMGMPADALRLKMSAEGLDPNVLLGGGGGGGSPAPSPMAAATPRGPVAASVPRAPTPPTKVVSAADDDDDRPAAAPGGLLAEIQKGKKVRRATALSAHMRAQPAPAVGGFLFAGDGASVWASFWVVVMALGEGGGSPCGYVKVLG